MHPRDPHSTQSSHVCRIVDLPNITRQIYERASGTPPRPKPKLSEPTETKPVEHIGRTTTPKEKHSGAKN